MKAYFNFDFVICNGSLSGYLRNPPLSNIEREKITKKNFLKAHLPDSVIENFTVFIAVALIFYPPVSKHLFLCPLFCESSFKKASLKKIISSHSLSLLL
jgi:hypothetical protein